jgi:hypothetical protein
MRTDDYTGAGNVWLVMGMHRGSQVAASSFHPTSSNCIVAITESEKLKIMILQQSPMA